MRSEANYRDMDSSSLLRIKLGLRTQKKDRGLALEQMQLWEGYWGKKWEKKRGLWTCMQGIKGGAAARHLSRTAE